VFLINLPIGSFALLALVVFLKVKSTKQMPLRQKLLRIDIIGNTIIIGSSVAVLYALTYGGSRHPWNTAQVLAPLIIGLIGMMLFIFVESSPYIREPVTPTRLFEDRTAVVIFIITFLNSSLTYWVLFFLPVYFQAVLLSSPSRSGVQVMPTLIVIVVAAIVAVIVLTKFGRYKGLHLAGFGLLTIGLGLYSVLDRHSSTAAWVMFQVLTATGSGMVVNTALPAFQACVAENDQASATAGWAFIRSFGNIWGVAIPAAVFNNRFDQLAYRISDAAVRSQLMGGHAYEHATKSFVKQFGEPLQSEVVGVFTDSLKLGWQLSTIFSGVSFLLVFLEREIPLRKELDTEFGMEDKAPK
ncbi:MFS general substrate transporter, partial [Teratosphaeria nubilosa]